MAPPNKSKQKRPKNRPPPSPHIRKIRFRTGEYDGDGEKKIVKKKKRRKKRREVELDSITNFLIQFRILSGKSSARDKFMAFAQSFFVFRQGLLGENHSLPHIYL